MGNCPKCGDYRLGIDVSGWVTFACGTSVHQDELDDDVCVKLGQSEECRLTNQVYQLMAEVERYRKLLDEVACSGVEFSAEGLGYVSIQIDSDTWDEIRALAEGEG